MAGSLTIDMSKGTAAVGTSAESWAMVVKGVEQVFGTSANDTLVGDKNHNTLNGEAGNDWFRSGLGADKLVGGEGNDTFAFTRKDVADKSVDWITDFEVGADRLDMRDFQAARGRIRRRHRHSRHDQGRLSGRCAPR